MPKLIREWKELKGMENDTYRIDVDEFMCNGHIIRKSDGERVKYLSTHTFYGKTYQESTIALQECGFDVQLKNWDGETENVDHTEQWKWGGKCEHCRRKKYCGNKCKARTRYEEQRDRLEMMEVMRDVMRR